MDQALDLALAVLAKVRSVWTAPQVLGSAAAAVLALLVAARVRFGPRAWTARVATPAVRTDAAYTVFYLGGIYAFLVSGPAYRFLSGLADTHVPFLRLDLLAHLPVWAQFFVASVAMDGVLYWTHRALHAWPWLWAFHSVHHSQREMTALANFRFHAGDVFVRGLAQFVPGLLLGIPAWVWLPTVWIQVALDCLAHSGLGWSYGPLGRVLVSPRFHRLHHSHDPAHRDRNFGMTYSFWDRLFGTADARADEPRGYGLDGVTLPPSFLRQLAYPFLYLAGAHAPASPRVAVAPAPEEAA
ncbi:MAG TPA: sterol desaturase family protein [Vicinamibacteria bacterium]|nr:sterol desaturase family protein [Vicinamibacteria bacterium]